MSVMDGLPWWVSPLQRGDMPSLYDFLHQAKQQKSSMETVITTHWLCGTNLWPWLPPGWIGMCTLGLAFAHGNIRSTIQEPLNLPSLQARWSRSIFHWYVYLAALFVPSLGTKDVMIRVEALISPKEP